MSRPWPIRWWLYLVVFATATPLCLFIAALVFAEARRVDADAERFVLSLASAAAENARLRLRETESLAAALAQRPRIRALDPAQCGDELMHSLLAAMPHYANISTVRPDGRFVCSALEGWRDVAVPLHGAITGALTGSFSVSSPLTGVLPRRLLVSTGYPVKDEHGTIAGVLTIPIDLNAFKPLNDLQTLPPGAAVRIIDDRGVLLASSSPDDPDLGTNVRRAEAIERVLQGDHGVIHANGSDGAVRIYGYRRIGTTGWRAYADVPAQALLAADRGRLIAISAAALALMASCLAVAAVLSSRIRAPLAALQRAMQHGVNGSTVAVPEAGPQELRAVAANYNRMVDVTRTAGDALAEGEKRLRLAVRASRIGLWDWNIGTGQMYFSPEWKRQLGYDDSEVGEVAAEWHERLHPDDRDRALAQLERVLADGGSHFEAEFRLRGKGGSYRWIYSSAEVMRDAHGNAQRMLGTHIDITSRKVLEQSLRNTVTELRVLSMRLMEAEEAERRRIGADLHDRTGANFAALQINLRRLINKLRAGDTGSAMTIAESAEGTLSDCTAEVRSLMTELRPAVLDDFGLYPAVFAYARHIASRFGLELQTSGEPPASRPAPGVETALFRIAQEAMTNAAKHAKAEALEVSLQVREGVLVLEVADDGAGFDAGGATRSDSLGLRTMRERAEAIGATFVLESVPGEGTRVQVEAPYA